MKTITKKDFNIRSESQVIGIVATLSPVKNHELLLNSAKIVLETFSKVKFVFVGMCEPNRRDLLNKFIRKLGIEESIIFAGEHDNPIPLMQIFDIGVLSSKSEGLSNTLIEYAAVGMPIVATAVGGNSDIVVHGENGYIVSPFSSAELANRIIQLLGDQDIRKRFAKLGQDRILKRYCQEKVLDNYRSYFEELLFEKSN